MKTKAFFIILLFIFPLFIQAQKVPDFFKGAGSPVNPKVNITWNRYYTYEGLSRLCREIATAYPGLARLESIGKSYQGRDIWALTITSFKNGKPEDKPGFYIDGNIHSNEIQGSEVALYTAWYLTENYGKVDFITSLLNDKVFYIVPTINPDARENFMLAPNNANSPRSGLIPVDDDRDGLYNEDGFDDLDGDGNITMMRRKNPHGKWIVDPQDSRRMIRVANDEFGDYEILGYEGIDNDGDGQVNEDPEGYYDPNRDWAFNWQPDYVQRGALPYPFYTPENKAVHDFVIAHPNIAGAQSYHNFGGMVLRGPAQKDYQETYNSEDENVLSTIGKTGEKIIPGYKYFVLWKDLYPAYGSEMDWFYGSRGIYVFSNELFSNFEYFGKETEDRQKVQDEQYDFSRFLLFGDAFVPWHSYHHPQYGDIEIGGFAKNFGRPHPGFLLEADAHRNMAFTLYHAYNTPELRIDTIEVKDAGKGLSEITVSVVNGRLSPTRSGQDREHNIDPEDRISISGTEALAKMIVTDESLNLTEVQNGDPSVINIASIPGMSVMKVRWIVRKSKHFTVTVQSVKGGKIIAER